MKLGKYKLLLIFFLLLPLTACSTETSTMLNGTYQMIDPSKKGDLVTTAVIEEDVITITEGLRSGETSFEGTVWVGSVKMPPNEDMPYTWTSVKNQAAIEARDNPMPLTVDKIDFTYDNNVLTYKYDLGQEGESQVREMRLERVQ